MTKGAWEGVVVVACLGGFALWCLMIAVALFRDSLAVTF